MNAWHNDQPAHERIINVEAVYSAPDFWPVIEVTAYSDALGEYVRESEIVNEVQREVCWN